MSIKNDNITKVIVVGMNGTGKTSMIRRYTYNYFDEKEKATVGMQNSLKQTQYTMKRAFKLSIWDIAGQDRYQSMTKGFVRHSMGCIVVCDAQNESSLQDALKWQSIVCNESQYGNNLPIILAQNKYDLLPNSIQQSESDQLYGTENHLNKFAETHDFNSSIQVSALNGHNIEELFKLLIDHMIQQEGDINLSASGNMEDNSISLSYYESQITKNQSDIRKNKKSSCC